MAARLLLACFELSGQIQIIQNRQSPLARSQVTRALFYLWFGFFDANRANDVCFCVSSDNKEEEEGEVK